MDNQLLKDLIELGSQFESSNANSNNYANNIDGFKKWLRDSYTEDNPANEPEWEGKKSGRTPESIIATSIVHMNRFGRNYFKAAIHGSEFSTPDDVIYLILLKFNPSITKMELIKKNVHEKPAGIQIINRLIEQGWVEQTNCETDKRSKVLNITAKGLKKLDQLLVKVRKATQIVSGDLTHQEKMEIIRLLNKLHDFHLPIYSKNLEAEALLDAAYMEMNKN